MFTNHIFSIFMYKQNLAISYLKWLICHKTKQKTNKAKLMQRVFPSKIDLLKGVIVIFFFKFSLFLFWSYAPRCLNRSIFQLPTINLKSVDREAPEGLFQDLSLLKILNPFLIKIITPYLFNYYTYIYIYVCVCVCVCEFWLKIYPVGF